MLHSGIFTRNSRRVKLIFYHIEHFCKFAVASSAVMVGSSVTNSLLLIVYCTVFAAGGRQNLFPQELSVNNHVSFLSRVTHHVYRQLLLQ
ncbi:hypothetical protein INT80_06875 [Gallibacterium anatis]|uniref:Uncharacterized protein n=1 Tax=Gallibacterium anatis TaxID=750 RepID=A0A930Y8M7_9PAST|nr:hypothetical protein [Gallibacterium anatis]